MDKTIKGISGFFRWVLFILMTSIVVLVVVQVFLRYVLKSSLMGIEEVLLFPAIWVYFIGAANASMEGSQIKANILDVYIKDEKLFFLERLVMSLLSSGIVLWLTYWGYDYFTYSIHAWKKTASLYVPLFYGESAVFICLVMISVFTLRELYMNYKNLRRAKIAHSDIKEDLR